MKRNNHTAGQKKFWREIAELIVLITIIALVRNYG
jgi:hypothetical protein